MESSGLNLILLTCLKVTLRKNKIILTVEFNLSITRFKPCKEIVKVSEFCVKRDIDYYLPERREKKSNNEIWNEWKQQFHHPALEDVNFKHPAFKSHSKVVSGSLNANCV